MKKQKRNSLLPQKLTRKERRALRNTHMPHTKASSRAVVTTTSDALRKALTEGFKTKHHNDVRIEFGKFLTKTYGMPPATAYSKLRYWHVEEWEAIGFYRMIARFILDILQPAIAATAPTSQEVSPAIVGEAASSSLPPAVPPSEAAPQSPPTAPFFPTTIEGTRQWHATIPRGIKMKFYDYISARGMCRERFTNIINGKTTISQMKAEGLVHAFGNYIESTKQNLPSDLGLE